MRVTVASSGRPVSMRMAERLTAQGTGVCVS